MDTLLDPRAPLLPQRLCSARCWLLLATVAMTLSALLAVLLVLSRTPGIQEWFGLREFFHPVLVLHVNFSVLVWLLAFGGMLWSLELSGNTPFRDALALGLAATGALLMLISPLAGGAVPVMSNYIPALDTPLFFTGLVGFAAGLSLMAVRLVLQPDGRLGEPLRLAALAWLVALSLFAWHGLQLFGSGFVAWEQLFWGGGHMLQFVYVLLLLGAWQVLASGRLPGIAWLALPPLIAGLALGWLLDPADATSRIAFTRLMRWGMPLLILVPLWRLLRDPALRRLTPVTASAGLMLLGLLVGLLISNDTVTVTAHYHATNAAITVAFMGLAYHLLPRLGFGLPIAAVARWQLRLYAGGMTLYVIGMAASGWLGVPRKSALSVDGGTAQAAMGVMGIGGLIAVVATLLFIALMFGAMLRRSTLPLHATMGGAR